MNEQIGARPGAGRNRPGSRKYIPAILRPGNIALMFAQEWLNRIFTPSLNPFYFLGAITFFLFWIVIGTGVYLWWFYTPTADQAYNSVQNITVSQKYYGGVIRSLHRYASDGLVIVISLHILQVFFSDRFRKNRWVAWVSGVAILLPVWLEGITGYFIVWDVKGQMIAQQTAWLLDALPVIVEPVSMSFVSQGALRYIIFFVILYFHMTLTGVLLALAWIHCIRIARPLINPPMQVGVIIFASLLALSIVKPAVSMGPADLTKLVGTIDMDWFFFIPYYFSGGLDVSSGWMWFGGMLGFTLMATMPWLIRESKKSGERQLQTSSALPKGNVTVDLESCKGCGLCFEACPFEAVNLEKRTDGAPYEIQASISPERCAECGFCVTACEFSAVSMEGWTKTTIHKSINALMSVGAEAGIGGPSNIVFICERSIDLAGVITDDGKRLVSADDAAVMVIPCIGVISPVIIDYCHKAGARKVAVVGCRALDCHYREARRRIKEKTGQAPATFLVEEMKDDKLAVYLVSPLEVAKLMMDINSFFESAGNIESSGDNVGKADGK